MNARLGKSENLCTEPLEPISAALPKESSVRRVKSLPSVLWIRIAEPLRVMVYTEPKLLINWLVNCVAMLLVFRSALSVALVVYVARCTLSMKTL